MAESIEYAMTRSAAEAAAVVEFYRQMFQDSPRVVDLLKWRHNAPTGVTTTTTLVARVAGEIVGAMNLEPILLRAGGREVKAAWQIDSIVSPALRGRGIGRELIERSAAEYEVILAKGTSEGMYKLRKSCGFRDVPNSNYLVRVLSPLRFGKTAKHKLIGLAAGVLGALKRRPSAPQRSIRTITRFEKRVDDLAVGAEETEIRVAKTSSYLNWRYGQCPGRAYTILGCSDGSEVAAAVVRIEPEAWLVDVLSVSTDDGILDTLIRASLETCRTAGAASMHTFATSPRARQRLYRAGFIELPSTPRFTYRARAGSHEFEQLVISGLGWNVWHGDGDIELYD